MRIDARAAAEAAEAAEVFSALADKSFTLAGHWNLALGAFLMATGSGVIGYFLAPRLGIAPKVLVITMMFNNCGNLGLPHCHMGKLRAGKGRNITDRIGILHVLYAHQRVDSYKVVVICNAKVVQDRLAPERRQEHQQVVTDTMVIGRNHLVLVHLDYRDIVKNIYVMTGKGRLQLFVKVCTAKSRAQRLRQY